MHISSHAPGSRDSFSAIFTLGQSHIEHLLDFSTGDTAVVSNISKPIPDILDFVERLAEERDSQCDVQ